MYFLLLFQLHVLFTKTKAFTNNWKEKKVNKGKKIRRAATATSCQRSREWGAPAWGAAPWRTGGTSGTTPMSRLAAEVSSPTSRKGFVVLNSSLIVIYKGFVHKLNNCCNIFKCILQWRPLAVIGSFLKLTSIEFAKVLYRFHKLNNCNGWKSIFACLDGQLTDIQGSVTWS